MKSREQIEQIEKAQQESQTRKEQQKRTSMPYTKQEKKTESIRLVSTKSVKKRFKKLSQETGISMGEWVAYWVETQELPSERKEEEE